MRTLGEPAGSRRLTDEQGTGDERRETVGRLGRRAPYRRQEPGRRAADECTSPSPYAEDFEEWVADEAAAPDGPQRLDAGDDAPRSTRGT